MSECWINEQLLLKNNQGSGVNKSGLERHRRIGNWLVRCPFASKSMDIGPWVLNVGLLQGALIPPTRSEEKPSARARGCIPWV